MGKPVKTYKVDNLNKVDTSRYVEGDLFITDKVVGILLGGKMKTIFTGNVSLKNYVKKDDVQKMIDEAMKKVKEDE